MYTKPGTKEVITSSQNPKVKNTLLLQKPRERKKQNLFIVEGKKEVIRAVQAGYTFKHIFICEEIFDSEGKAKEVKTSNGKASNAKTTLAKTTNDKASDVKASDAKVSGYKTSDVQGSNSKAPDRKAFDIRDSNTIASDDQEISKKTFETEITETSASVVRKLSDHKTGQPEINYVIPKVYAHMAYRKESEGIIGCAIPRAHDLENIGLPVTPLILVVEAVEKPGNLGALLRTADAAGIDALIISDPRTDLYNPNVVRSSLGALFSVQIGTGSTEEVIQWLKKNQVSIYCTSLSASKAYTEIDFRQSSALIMGTEATGLSKTWLARSDQNIIIPMQGYVDSMNVSVSAGIVLFEALRQRRKATGDIKLS